MDDVLGLLLGPQRSSGSMAGIVVAIVAVLLATALIGYFVWCYLRAKDSQANSATDEAREYRASGGDAGWAGARAFSEDGASCAQQ
jgi:hypothetical protein